MHLIIKAYTILDNGSYPLANINRLELQPKAETCCEVWTRYVNDWATTIGTNLKK